MTRVLNYKKYYIIKWLNEIKQIVDPNLMNKYSKILNNLNYQYTVDFGVCSTYDNINYFDYNIMNNETLVDEYLENNKSQCDKCSRLLVVQDKGKWFCYPCSIDK